MKPLPRCLIECWHIVSQYLYYCTNIIHVASSSTEVSSHDITQNKDTALHKASGGGHVETVTLLLEKGADPNTTDKVRVVCMSHHW